MGTFGTVELNRLKDEAHRIAVGHGWHEKEYSDEHWLCLVISELMEAVNADRKNKHADRKSFEHAIDNALREEHLFGNDYDVHFSTSFKVYIKDTVEDELADVVIRLLDFAGLKKVELLELGSIADTLEKAQAGYKEEAEESMRETPFTEICYLLCRLIANTNRLEDCWVGEWISSLIESIEFWCDAHNIDLRWHVEQKMEYNALRSYKHGCKEY